MIPNTSSLLIDESPLQVLPSLAIRLGLNEAIALQQVHYWLRTVEKSQSRKPNQPNFLDDRWWTYSSYREWRERNFPFWSEKTIERTFRSLENLGILISGNFSKNKFDRSKWYTIDYDRLNQVIEEACRIDQDNLSLSDGSGQNDVIEDDILTAASGQSDEMLNNELSIETQPGEVMEAQAGQKIIPPQESEHQPTPSETVAEAPAPKPPHKEKGPPKNIAPEIKLYLQVTNRYPSKQQIPIAIERIKGRGYTAEHLRPFWQEWVARDHRPTSLGWLDWVESGVIPRPWEQTNNRRSGKPRGFDAIREVWEGLQNGDE